MFKYPVLSTERPQVNWELANVDLLVLDELSMIPVKIFQHIIETIQQLHIRPVLLLCGDDQQQQPIVTVDGKTTQTTSILQHRPFYATFVKVDFHTQHRCQDPQYAEMLDTIRYYKPSRELLDRLEEGKVSLSNARNRRRQSANSTDGPTGRHHSNCFKEGSYSSEQGRIAKSLQ